MRQLGLEVLTSSCSVEGLCSTRTELCIDTAWLLQSGIASACSVTQNMLGCKHM